MPNRPPGRPHIPDQRAAFAIAAPVTSWLLHESGQPRWFSAWVLPTPVSDPGRASGRRDGKSECERRTAPGLGPGPDAAAVTLDDFATNREAETRPGVFPAMDAMVYIEDPFGVLRAESDTVVAHADKPFAACLFGDDSDASRRSTAKL